MNIAGSLKAILWEARNGTFFTVLDEIWHMKIFNWAFPELHCRFCQWSHGIAFKKREEAQDE